MRANGVKSFVLKSVMVVFFCLLVMSVLQYGHRHRSHRERGSSGHKDKPVNTKGSHRERGSPGHKDEPVNTKGSHRERGSSGHKDEPVNTRGSHRERGSSGHKDEPVNTKVPSAPSSSVNSQNDHKVIVLSYMRSGSTLTGDIYNHHSEVFYSYEPLLQLYLRYVEKHKPATFFNRDPLEYDPAKVQGLAYETMNQTINCDFMHLYTPFFFSRVSRRNSLGAQDYNLCVGLDKTPTREDALKCMGLLLRNCARARVIVAKVVRLSMEMAGRFLGEDPKVKVVHLLRDPRGVMQSMQSSGLDDRYHLQSKAFCDKVLKDLQDSMSLKQKFPGRVMTIRYEDLAEKPLDFAARLLRFADLDMEASLRDYVWNITSSESDTLKTTKFNTLRSDSRAAARAWRDTITPSLADDVQKNCAEIFRLMGYLPLKESEQLRDQNLSYFNQDYTAAPIGLWKGK